MECVELPQVSCDLHCSTTDPGSILHMEVLDSSTRATQRGSVGQAEVYVTVLHIHTWGGRPSRLKGAACK